MNTRTSSPQLPADSLGDAVSPPSSSPLSAPRSVKDPGTEVSLIVTAGPAPDLGRGLAWMAPEMMKRMGVVSGDPVEVTGLGTTVARAIPADEVPPGTREGASTIALDGLLRANARICVGDAVTVRKAEPQLARRVVFAPAQPEIRLQGNPDAIRAAFIDRVMLAGDMVATVGRRLEEHPALPDRVHAMLDAPRVALTQVRLKVVLTEPAGVVAIGSDTRIELQTDRHVDDGMLGTAIRYDDLGGIDGTIAMLREWVELPLRAPGVFRHLGAMPPRGILICGPRGTGKTSLAHAVANEAGAQFFQVYGPRAANIVDGEHTGDLATVFRKAAASERAIIFIDELDLVAPQFGSGSSDLDKRFLAHLLMLMDRLATWPNVVVLAASTHPEAIETALRRPGRFDREIMICAPDGAAREAILSVQTRAMPLAADVDLAAVARDTPGFVGADLSALIGEAAIAALRRSMARAGVSLPSGEQEDQWFRSSEILSELKVSFDDFRTALKCIQPSALRETMVEVPVVRWSDIGGLDRAVAQVQEGIELPLRHPEALRRMGIRAAKGFLFYGPPGTGKTMLARAVASESRANFIAVKAADLLSKWIGESERHIARLFARARQVAPCILFLDELDSLVPARGGELGTSDRVVNAILSEMDGIEPLQQVVVIGATNRPTLVDPALLRPGRFDELVYVGLPDAAGRRHILNILTSAMPLDHAVDLDAVAAATDRFTGADLDDVVRRAGLSALRRDLHAERVMPEDMLAALSECQPSVTPEVEAEYAAIAGRLKQDSLAIEPIGFIGPGMLRGHGPKGN